MPEVCEGLICSSTFTQRGLFVLLSGKRSLIPTSCFPPHTDQLHTHTHTQSSRRRQQTHTHTHTQWGNRRRQEAHTHTHWREPHQLWREATQLQLTCVCVTAAVATIHTLLPRDLQTCAAEEKREIRAGEGPGHRRVRARDAVEGEDTEHTGSETAAVEAWSISWCPPRRCLPCSSSRRRRRTWSEVSAGAWAALRLHGAPLLHVPVARVCPCVWVCACESCGPSPLSMLAVSSAAVPWQHGGCGH